MRDLQLKQLAWAWMASFWSVSAIAAQATFPGDLSSIPPAAVAIAVALAFCGGAAATLRKIANPATVVRSVPLEILADMGCSVLAGLVTYFFCAWREYAILLQACLIPLAGFGGSRLLEKAITVVEARIDRLAGSPPESTP